MTMSLPQGNEVVAPQQQIIMWTRGNTYPGAMLALG